MTLAKAIWSFRWPVLVVFMAVACLDLVLGSLRSLLTQGAMFVLGLLIGRYARQGRGGGFGSRP